MNAGDLPVTKNWTGGLISWERNGDRWTSKPYAIEHVAGFVYLHITGWRAHELRADQEIEVQG